MDAAVKKVDKTPDIILLLVTLILVTVGTAMIYSSSSIIALEKFKDSQYFLKKQILFVSLGLDFDGIDDQNSLHTVKKISLSRDVFINNTTRNSFDTGCGNKTGRGDALAEYRRHLLSGNRNG